MASAFDADIDRLACAGTSPDDWSRVAEITERFPQVIPSFGLHPWFVKGRDISPSYPEDAARPALEPYLWKQNFHELENLLAENPEAGIGETGLDFSSFAKAPADAEAMADKTEDRQERFTNRAQQEGCFAAHIDLARELNRPVVVHCVHAWGRLIEILREHSAPRVLLHAFGGAPELIPELSEMNCWFSFCGSVTNPNAKRVRAAAVAVPENRLLIETDAPDFTPAGMKPPNEPANLVHAAHAVAELRRVSIEEIARITFNNAEAFFGLTHFV